MELAQEQCWAYLACFTLYKIDSSLSSPCKATDTNSCLKFWAPYFKSLSVERKHEVKKNSERSIGRPSQEQLNDLVYLAWGREDCKQKRQLQEDIHDIQNAQIHTFFLKRFVLHACMRQN